MQSLASYFDLYVLSEAFAQRPAGLDLWGRAAYYSIDDFAQALQSYQNKYKDSNIFSADRWLANEDKLRVLQDLSGHSDQLRFEEQRRQRPSDEQSIP
ncbi:MAG: hypothetical protein FWF71_07110 [Actinomycetia bacterium]|nr:hypothetical protein [Actinomycetes bacterium]